MRKILFIAVMTVAVFACSKDEKPVPEDVLTEDSWDIKLKKEYNITAEGLNLESLIANNDSTKITINGRVNGCLWIGYFDITTKESIVQWQDMEQLDTVQRIDLGYGDYEDIKINSYRTSDAYLNNNSFCFLVYGHPFYRISQLYFLKNQLLVKKYEKQGELHFDEFIQWHSSIIVGVGESDRENRKFICFSETGDSLYCFTAIPAVSDRDALLGSETLSTKEYLSIKNENEIFRYNLKKQTYVWRLYFDTPGKSRLDRKVLSKDGDTWTYTFFYTLIDGAKVEKDIAFNITTGDVVEDAG